MTVLPKWLHAMPCVQAKIKAIVGLELLKKDMPELWQLGFDYSVHPQVLGTERKRE
jgi:hypothetical protein